MIKRVLLGLNWYSEQLVKGVVAFARSHDWSLDFYYMRNRDLKDWCDYDGAVVNLLGNSQLRALLEKHGLPWVELSIPSVSEEARVVRTSDKAIGKMAVDYFLSKEYSNFGYYHQGVSPHGKERIAGFVEALKNVGCAAFEVSILKGDAVSFSSQSSSLIERLRSLPKPIAIFCPNDHFAYDLLEACIEASIKVPEDVAILGANNEVNICELAPVALSSIDANLAGVGFAGAKRLHQFLENGVSFCEETESEMQFIAPIRVVERASTDTSSIDDPMLREAIHFIRSHYDSPINAESVARHLSISVSQLYSLFKNALPFTVRDEINRLRLKKAKMLLSKSDHKFSHIAWACGFRSREAFSRFFKKETDMTMSEFRELMESHERPQLS